MLSNLSASFGRSTDELLQSLCFLTWPDMQDLATESHELHCQSFLYHWDCSVLSCKCMVNLKRNCLRSWNLYIRSEVPSLWIYSVLPAVQEPQVCVALWPFPFHLLQCLQNTRDREVKLKKKYRMSKYLTLAEKKRKLNDILLKNSFCSFKDKWHVHFELTGKGYLSASVAAQNMEEQWWSSSLDIITSVQTAIN